MERKPVRIIAAVSKDNGIGKDGTLPWNLPEEFKFFRKSITTVSRPGKMNMVIWGKKCWYSNPASLFMSLSNDLHVVLSKTMTEAPEHAHFVCEDFDAAVRLAAQPPLSDLIETIWVVGGTNVYEDAMKHPFCDLLFITDIMKDFNCDVFFPELNKKEYKLLDRYPGIPSEIQEERGIQYKFQVFKRVTGNSG